MRERLQNDYYYESFRVVCFVVNRQNLLRKVLISLWMLRFVISPSCCLSSQCQWITYDMYHLIYHPNVFIAQEHL